MTSVTVSGDALSFTVAVAGDFDPLNITGEAQSTIADLSAFSVSDLSGTGAGWQVTAKATQFETALGAIQLETSSGTGSTPVRRPAH